jgi:hypothetical protein
MLRRIFGSGRKNATQERMKWRNEMLYDLYPSPDIVRMIKSRRMR